MIALLLAAAAAVSSPKTEPFFGLPKGKLMEHVPCSITLEGRAVFAGRCLANTKTTGYPLALFVEQEDSGCEADFSRKGAATTASLSGYRQSCTFQGSDDDAAASENVVKQGDCWDGKRLRVCVGSR